MCLYTKYSWNYFFLNKPGLRAGNFSHHHRGQNVSGAHPASYPNGYQGLFPGGKAGGAWSWPLNCISCRGQRMCGAIHPLPKYAFMSWCSVKINSTGTTLPSPYSMGYATQVVPWKRILCLMKTWGSGGTAPRILNLGIRDGGEWSASRPGRFTPGVRNTGCAQRRYWRGGEKIPSLPLLGMEPRPPSP
jgi:hypothetical protein